MYTYADWSPFPFPGHFGDYLVLFNAAKNYSGEKEFLRQSMLNLYYKKCWQLEINSSRCKISAYINISGISPYKISPFIK